jgi:hypothetical protein
MTTQKIETLLYCKPFQPVRLVLDDGEEVLLRKERKAHVSGGYIACVGISRNPDHPSVERFRIIQVDRVVSAGAVPNR